MANFYSACINQICEDLDKRKPDTRLARVKAVLNDTSQDARGIWDIFRPSRRGAEIGFGLYLIVAAAIGLAGLHKSDGAAIQVATAGLFSIKWMAASAGAGILFYTPFRMAALFIGRLWRAIFDPHGFNIYADWEVREVGRKAKERITTLKLSPSDRTYFFQAMDKAEFMSDIAWLMSHAEEVANLHPHE